jgi:segregation and condensation protein A
MAVHYKLESFEGPLDLLLHLIDKAEVDIYNIPINDITNQYMDYLSSMEQIELGPTSEFLVMAATLLSIKSKMLLPKPPADLDIEGYEEGVDPREELVQKLIEYRKYKGIADHLRDKELARSLIYSREPEDLTPFIPEVTENPLKGLHLADLVLAFQKALRKSVKRNTVAKIRRDEISVKDRIREVIDILKASQGKLLFSKLFSTGTREEIVVTFLAILELMKVKRITCFQHSLFDDIVIQYRDEGDENGIPVDEIDY